jgi:arylsulfatase
MHVRLIILLLASWMMMLDAALLAAVSPDRPNIVVILTDQWNPRCLGYAGDPNVSTPNLDQLAAEGMVFDNCYIPCPVCMPARCGLMSGLYPYNLGLFGNTGEYCLPPRQGRMFQDIQAAGYATAQIGKLHWAGGQTARKQFGSLESYYEALGLDHCEYPITTNSANCDDVGRT